MDQRGDFLDSFSRLLDFSRRGDNEVAIVMPPPIIQKTPEVLLVIFFRFENDKREGLPAEFSAKPGGVGCGKDIKIGLLPEMFGKRGVVIDQ